MRTSDEVAAESIHLQKASHVKQQDIIKDKKMRAEITQKMKKKQREAALNKSLSVDSQATLDDCEEQERELVVYRTMEETDSLLTFLKKRADGSTDGHPKNPLLKSASKIPKDEKQIVEELRIHNEALRNHVLQLLRELDERQRENANLRERLRIHEEKKYMANSYDSETYFSVPISSGIDLPDLPPLEMPTFDFNSLKEELNK